MLIFVLSLPTSIKRRKRIKNIMAEHNIDFQFIDAIDGRKDKHPYLSRYNEKLFIYNHKRKAMPGELGCYASHILAWEKCISINKPIIVLEDDLILNNKSKKTLEYADCIANKYGYIRLEKTKPKPSILEFEDGRYKLNRYLKVPQCTTGYSISPSVAKSFIKNSKEIIFPVDVFIRNIFIHKQKIYGLTPYALEANSDGDTIIGKRSRLKKGLYLSLICSIYKIKNSVLNGYQHLKSSL
ncbi:glycosyltransferase family 25 protein [Vibrio breoganii]|uniref:glycosyltransferase family 25 protein n=1 Tax=Vibrio breoganii TaxID=553239 RepID=UPI000C828FAE|nr:glycosyltransferase family 25 protein [Vibrio breoganii]PMK63059.1 hypothetical protein BCT98_00330 [Vibrio breoganii]PMK73955.1 hypothetical protein BCT94_11035 [Vibrio breoganii]